MKYEVKFKRVVEQEDGKKKTVKASLLVEDVSLLAATVSAEKYMAADECSILSVTCSTIREECNPSDYDSQDPVGWTVTLERKYEIDDKEKKMRYPVLLWSKDLPSEKEGALKTYLQTINEGMDDFKVVKITKSPIEECLGM